MSNDTKWIIGTIISAALVVAGLLSAQIAGVNTRIDDLRADLTARMDRLEARLEARMDRLEARLEARMDGLDARMDGLEERVRAVEIALRQGRPAAAHHRARRPARARAGRAARPVTFSPPFTTARGRFAGW